MSETQPRKLYRFAKLTAEREEKITELVQRMRDAFHPLPAQLRRWETCAPSSPDAPTTVNSTRLYCYSFLQAREWNVDKAFAMMKASVAYRLENGLDKRCQLPPVIPVYGWDVSELCQRMEIPLRTAEDAEDGVDDRVSRIAAATRSFLELGYHGWDRSGLPNFYIMLGNTHAKRGIKKLKQIARVGETPLDVCWKVLQHAMGVGEDLYVYQQSSYDRGQLDVDASEGYIRASNIIVDMTGFTLRLVWKPAIDLMRGSLKRLFEHYPDCVHRIHVINCPATILFAYKLIRPVLPAAVQRKVRFVNPGETLASLSVFVDPANIPRCYGGQCSCEENSCFSASRGDAAVDPDDAESDMGDVMTENVTVTAGSDYCRVFELSPGDTVVWEFAAAQGNSVAFTVYFVPQAEATEMKWSTVSSKRLEPFVVSRDPHLAGGADTYVAQAAGTLVLMWANRKSWFSSKHIQLRVYREARDVGSSE